MLLPNQFSRSSDQHIIASLDIGTSKIAVVIGEVEDDGKLIILGVGVSPSHGLRQGVVINLEQAIQSIRNAVQEAQLTAGIQIQDVIVGIAGEHVHSVNSRGVVGVSRSDHEITEQDVDRVLEAARAIALPQDREVLHVLPQEYFVDNQGGIKNPIGISGVRLEAEVHIVTGAGPSAQNIIRSVSRTGLNVIGMVLEPLASSYAVLDNNEKELGVALIDLGGGTTDLAIFYDGTIRHTAVVPLGGQNVTNDIALGLKTPVENAEIIKRKYGCAFQDSLSQPESFLVKGIGGRDPREVSRQTLAAIIQPRMEEIFSLVAKEIKRSDYSDKLAAGIVLTGGGALLDGCDDLADQLFGHESKIGIPQGFGGLVESAQTPVLATGVGLVLFGMEDTSPSKTTGRGRHGFWAQQWIERVKDYLKDYFK
jgi:cell division protein FtsA